MIKTKPVDVKSNIYIDSSKEINNKDPKFKIADIARLSKFNIFAKGCTPNQSEEVFVIKKVKNTVRCTYIISDLKWEEIVETFYEYELRKTNQSEFRIEKVIKRNSDKLYVKWKGYDNSFNSWINKEGSINEWIFLRTKISRRKSELDLSNYATETDFKNATGTDTSSFA